MEQQTALDLAITHVGTQQALADALGIQSPSISEWKSRGRVPAERCRAIQDATGGRVTVHDLRPDVFGPPTAEADAPPSPPAPPASNRIDTPEAVTRLLGVSRAGAEPAPAAAAVSAEPEPEAPGDSRVVPFEAPP